MIKLVIFDLDGTLLNTIDDLASSCNYLLRKYHLPEHTTDQYRHFVGNGIPKLLERMLPAHLKTDHEFRGALLEEFLDHYAQHKADLTAPYQGIPELLATLRDCHIAIAVASNKAHEAIAPLLKHYFPDIPFAASFGQRTGFPLKPDAAVVEAILEIVQVDKSETLYVGDTGVDMQTAVNANVTAIGALWGFRTKEEILNAGAHYVVTSP
ncbi:MAG: HAD family hydrolase, partial [Bacteroidales bacterium]|nr:HAD family hydrolase [Bacteroidales bacterium]